MTANVELDGWKAIATYVGRSVKTVQRWEQECSFPVQRIPGRKSIFAYQSDIDRWLSNGRHSGNCQLNSGSGHLTAFWNQMKRRRELPFLWGMTMVLGWIFAIFVWFWVPADTSEIALPSSSLRGNLEDYASGSVLRIIDETGVIRLERRWSGQYAQYLRELSGSRFWVAADLNDDGRDDIVINDPERDSGSRMEVFLQRDNGNLTRFADVDQAEVIEYGNQLFGCRMIVCTAVGDVTGDGKPEIVVSRCDPIEYPCVVSICESDGTTLGKLLHPGRLNSIQLYDVDGDGCDELFLAGTNNFIAPYSEPVVMKVDAKWSEVDKPISLFSPNRCMASGVPEGVTVVYARLGDFPEGDFVSEWEKAWLRPLPSRFDTSSIQVDAGQMRFPIPVKVPVQYRYQTIRNFEFNLEMVQKKSFFYDLAVREGGFDPGDPFLHSCLKARYWNGMEWQDTVCTMPLEN